MIKVESESIVYGAISRVLMLQNITTYLQQIQLNFLNIFSGITLKMLLFIYTILNQSRIEHEWEK